MSNQNYTNANPYQPINNAYAPPQQPRNPYNQPPASYHPFPPPPNYPNQPYVPPNNQPYLPPNQAYQPVNQGFQPVNQGFIYGNPTGMLMCPTCQRETGNITIRAPGGVTWIWCFALFICTGICCCIPFCVDSCKDTVYRCAACQGVKGRV